MTAPWITYRPELKVLDCTVRDGGLINDHCFEDDFVAAVYRACVDSGVDYMELGYKASKEDLPPHPSMVPGSIAMRTTCGGSWATTTRRSSSRSWSMPESRTGRHRHPAQEGKRPRLDPRGLLRQPGARGRGHDQGRPRQRLRSVGQPDGTLPGHRGRTGPGLGTAGRNAGQHAGGGRQFWLALCRAGRTVRT